MSEEDGKDKNIQEVEEFFGEFAPDLLSYFGNPGLFWPRVQDNSISSEELGESIRCHLLTGAGIGTSMAALWLLVARVTGHLPTPNT